MAANTDKFIKGVSNWVGAIGAAGVPGPADTTIPLISTIGLPDDTAVELMIDRIDLNGVPTPGEMEVIRGVVSGNNIIDCVRGVEGTAQAHVAGAFVEVILTADMWNRMIDAMVAGHGQTGEHTSATVEIPMQDAEVKNAIADDDEFSFLDSAAEFVLKKCTWSNIKSILKTYFDTIYATISYVDSKVLDGPTPYIHLGMSTTHTVDNGTTINFDTVRSSNGMTKNGNGVDVKAGKTYKIMSWINITNNWSGGGYLGYALYDKTTALPGSAYSANSNSTSGHGMKAPAIHYYTPTVDGIIYVKVNDDNIGTAQVQAVWNTSLIVEQVIGMKGDKGDPGDVGVNGQYVPKTWRESDSTLRNFSTSWSDGFIFTQRTIRNNFDVKLDLAVQMRNDSASWGGGYVEIQVSINGGAYASLGSSGYDCVMDLSSHHITHWTRSLCFSRADLGAPASGDFTVRFKLRHRSYDGTLQVNPGSKASGAVFYSHFITQEVLMG